MTHSASTAYACVAYRIMEYEGENPSEEYMEILLEMLYSFYTENEIKKIYCDDVLFDSFDAVVNDEKIKKEISIV